MDVLKTWACSILAAALAMIVIDQLLPDGKIRKTARFAVAVIMMTVMVLPLVNISEAGGVLDRIGSALQQDGGQEYDSVSLYENNAERMLKRALDKVEGFENCNIYVTAEQIDYICTVTRIVIYCTDKNGANDEAVIAQLAEYYGIDPGVITISR